MRRIPEREWLWDGHAAHLIVGSRCQFHLATRIGDYLVSTVGEYRPPTSKDADGEGLYDEFETVGAGRLFETFVFRTGGSGFGYVTEWSEIDAKAANDHDAATANHMAMCDKYAALER